MRTEQEDGQGVVTQQNKLFYKPVHIRTAAYARSAISQIVSIANGLRQPNSKTEIVLNSGNIIVV